MLVALICVRPAARAERQRGSRACAAAALQRLARAGSPAARWRAVTAACQDAHGALAHEAVEPLAVLARHVEAERRCANWG